MSSFYSSPNAVAARSLYKPCFGFEWLKLEEETENGGKEQHDGLGRYLDTSISRVWLTAAPPQEHSVHLDAWDADSVQTVQNLTNTDYR